MCNNNNEAEMGNDAFQAIALRIIEGPRLVGATKAERQAAFRARRTGLKVLEKAAREREFDETVLKAAFIRYGLRLVRSTRGYSIVADGDGLEIRRNIVKALRTYCRSRYVTAYNATRPSEQKSRMERRAQLVALGIDLTRFREVCDVIDRTLAPPGGHHR
jgi:hypothetical protein